MKENTNLNEHIRILAKQHNVPCISWDTERRLTQHLMKYKPINCLEVGSAIGCSTLHIASIIDQRNGILKSFEISHPTYMSALRHQRQAHITNAIIYQNDFLGVPLERLITKPLDFVFVDAAKAHYHLFMEKIFPFCSPTATIVCDDVVAFSNKVDPLYARLDQHHLSYEVVEAETGDGLLVIRLT